MKVKTEIDLIEVHKGNIKKIKFNDKIFVSEDSIIIHHKSKLKRKWQHKNIPKPADKGELICTYSGLKIFTNVIFDILEVMSHSKWKNRDIRCILKKYYPDNKMSTLDTKLCVFTRYIRENNLDYHSKII